MRIAITGANSSVGKALLRRIAEQGAVQAHAGVRSQAAADTLPEGQDITPFVIRYDLPDTLATLLDGVDCLVHLAGVLIEGPQSSYQVANVDATQAVVDACQQAGVGHIVFISSLGADLTAKNRYYRSKAAAEQIVAQSGLASAIIRTPMLLGPDTAAGRALVGMASRDAVKVLGGGHHSLRPLDIDDLSDAILNWCRAPTEGTAIHALVGPQPVTHRALIDAIAGLMGREVSIGSVPVWVAKCGATIAGWVKRGGMTRTVIDVITADEAVHTNADVDLGVRLTPLSSTLQKLHPRKTPTS